MKKRGVACSGGGNMGTFVLGVLAGLNKKYDVITSNSTSSIIAPFIETGEYEIPKEGYFKATNKVIYKDNPFTRKKKFRFIKVITAAILKKDHIATHNLKKLIQEYLSKSSFVFKNTSSKIFACVTNYSTGKAEFRPVHKLGPEDAVDSIVASASFPVLFPPVRIKGNLYYDGGVTESVAIQKAIDEGCDEVDVILTSPYKRKKEIWEPEGLLSVIIKTIKIWNKNVRKDDITIGTLAAKNKNVKLNFYYTPYELTANPMNFDDPNMNSWYDLGVQAAKSPKKKYLKSGKKIQLL